MIIGIIGQTIDSSGRVLGSQGSGKDTVARMVREMLAGTTTMSLADPIKEVLVQLMEVPSDLLFGSSHLRAQYITGTDNPDWWGEADKRLERRVESWSRIIVGPGGDAAGFEQALRAWWASLPREPTTIRLALQSLGTECGRKFRQSIWCDYLLRQARRALQSGAIRCVVVADVRLEDEARAIESMHPHSLWLVRRRVDGPQDSQGGVPEHLSETGVREEWATRLADVCIDNDSTLYDLRFRTQAAVDKVRHYR